MTRQTPRSPKGSDQALHRLADSVERLVEVLVTQHVEAAPPAVVEAAQVNQTVCRLLGLRNYGQWIEIPGRPSTPAQRQEPSQLTVAGVLVGIRPGDPGRDGQPPRRVLVLRQGAEQAAHAVRVDEPVNTYPMAAS